MEIFDLLLKFTKLQNSKFKIMFEITVFWICFGLIVQTVDAVVMNRPPQFVPGEDMGKFSLSEKTPVNSSVYQLRGIDPEGGKLIYSISGPVFNIDRDTGLVKLVQELDREKQSSVEIVISLTDEATEGNEPNTISLRRVIPIRDFNDNAPTFQDLPYTAILSESTPVGSTILISPPIQVVDHDEGVNSEINFTCHPEHDDDETCETFALSTLYVADGLYNATITLTRKLDFEQQSSYLLHVLAMDGAKENPLSAFATVAIDVLDVQDQPPVFINAPYTISVTENTPVGVSVLSIKAHDGDIGRPRPVTITTDDPHFDIEVVENGKVNLVTTKDALDREADDILQNGGFYTFKVTASEVGGGINDTSTTEVTVIVSDVDDNFPEFSQSIYNVTVPEGLEFETALPGLAVYVTDKDVDENSRYKVSLKNIRNSDGVFRVSPAEGFARTLILVRVLKPEKLDYDIDDHSLRHFEFELIAESESGDKKSSVVVNVHLSDLNDNLPVFANSSYVFSVEENSPIGHKVADLQAVDKDSGAYGTVSYALQGFGTDYFSTNESTGGIYVKKLLDYEEQKFFVLLMVATDGGGRKSYTNIHVDLLNMNDNYPAFEHKEYTRTLREGATKFQPPMYLKAKDRDNPKHGSEGITYSIESENSISGHVFSINSTTGEVQITQPVNSMDTETGQYELKVKATDGGQPPLTNTTWVKIRIGISRNQRPVFRGHFAPSANNIPGPPVYRASILETAKYGDNVTQVKATDPDGIDSELVYQVVGANDNFALDERSGLLTVSKEGNLDRDFNGDSYAITVIAIDAGIPIKETATTTVYVTVLDVNNKPPKFKTPTYTAFISEIAEIDTQVLQVEAEDNDQNAELRYSIADSEEMSRAGTIISSMTYKDIFRVDNVTGIVHVNSTLNFKRVSSVLLTIEVRDFNAVVDKEEQFDTTYVRIFIQPFKPTDPIFIYRDWTAIRPWIHAEVDEEHTIGSTFLKLEAEDPIAQSIITDFELVTPDQDGYVKLNERTGELSLRKRLDYEALNSTYLNFTVQATSSNGKRSSVAKVNVTVKNINDNSPVFEKNSYKVTILESVKYPEAILTLKATDADAVRSDVDRNQGFSEVLYSLIGINAALFTVDNQTGIVRVAESVALDREELPLIKLTGLAQDAYGSILLSTKTTVNIQVELLDVNDNAPMFDDARYTAVIPETAPTGTSIAVLHAKDLDEGPGGEVSYELLNAGDALGLVKINAKSGKLETSALLTGKGRHNPYELTIRAQDNGAQVPKQESFFSDVVFLLYIGDVCGNDGVPNFVAPKIGQNAMISEDAPIGSPVIQVIATDPDSEDTPSGKLRYRIQEDTYDAKFFKIDALNGFLTTTKPLDREAKDTFTLIIEVSDLGEPPQSTARVLTIHVLDVDDHTPHFDRAIEALPLQFEIQEEQPNGTFINHLGAIDEDSGENGAIDYAIIDGNELELFNVTRLEDNRAMLVTNGRLDREVHESFLITIKCFKLSKDGYRMRGQYNPQDLSEIQVHIAILDVDDHDPEFSNDEYIGVNHNIAINTLVTTIHVHDVDSSALPINLTLEDVNFVSQFYRKSNITVDLKEIFILFNTNEIRNAKILHDFVDGYFEVKIRANNSEHPRRYKDTVIKIFVIRDKSLLRFVFTRSPNEILGALPDFSEKVKDVLKESQLELSIFDAQVLSRDDNTLDFTSTTACFQLSRHGSPLAPHEMEKLMLSKEMQNSLSDIYTNYSVSAVESCAGSKIVTVSSLTGTWLVVISGIIGLVSMAVLLLTYCFYDRIKLKPVPTIQTQRVPASEIYPSASQPALVANEPIYGPL